MSTAYDLGPAPTRIAVGVEVVQQLIAEQFPQWAHLPIRAVANGGWDNRTFHLGPEMSVRLPSAAEYALAVEKEHRWLPWLAEQLPLPISTPLGRGEPGAGYPFAWSVYRWLPGEPVTVHSQIDPVRLALDLAGFLAALQRIDPADGPSPGTHNWFRGGTLRTFDAMTQTSLDALRGHLDVSLAREIWATALGAGWDRVPVWFHGDVAVGNLLMRDGRLGAVIDFGTCGVGDPSCDLAVAWTLLDAESRRAFRDRLGVDEGSWARGSGWALWKALTTYARTVDRDDEESRGARGTLEALFEEHETN